MQEQIGFSNRIFKSAASVIKKVYILPLEFKFAYSALNATGFSSSRKS